MLIKELTNKQKNNNSNLLKFIIPSLIGVTLFMVPIYYNGELSIPIAVCSNIVQGLLGDILPLVLTILICLVGVITAIYKITKDVDGEQLVAIRDNNKWYKVRYN